MAQNQEKYKQEESFIIYSCKVLQMATDSLIVLSFSNISTDDCKY